MLHSMLLVINVPIALLLLSLASHFTLFQTDSDCRGLMKLSTSSRGWSYVANTLTRYNIRHHVRYWIVNAAERSRTLGCSCVIVLLQRTQLAPTELHHCECVCVCACMRVREREQERKYVCQRHDCMCVCVCECIPLSGWTNSLTCDVLILSLCTASLRVLLSKAQETHTHTHTLISATGRCLRSLTSEEDFTYGNLNACHVFSPK